MRESNRDFGFFGFVVFAFASCLADAQPLDVTGSLSGVVTAPSDFQAAQIYALNVDKHIQHVVYSSEGRYRAINLFPGDYEVRVEKRGFTSDIQRVTIDEGQSINLNLELREVSDDSGPRSDQDAELVAYDSLYPPGPGRDALERNCTYCHTRDALNDLRLPSLQWTRSQWELGVDLLLNVGGPRGTMHRSVVPETTGLVAASTISLHPVGEIEISAQNTLSTQDRELILDYLTVNFGPNSTRRSLLALAEPDIPLDEQALANAMYVQYHVLPDPEIDMNGATRQVQDPHFDNDGNVWFTDRGRHNRVGKLDPRTGSITDYLLPDTRDLDPHGLTVDAEGHVWWIREWGLTLGRLDPSSGEMWEYSANVDNSILGGAIHDPALDSAQNVWFSVMSGNHLGKWERESEKITLYTAPTQGEGAYGYGILVDRRDKVWYATYQRCDLTTFDPVTASFTEYHALGDREQGCIMRRLDEDSDGAIWYGIYSHGKLGKLDPRTGEQLIYDMPVPFGQPYATQIDPEGNVWMGDDTTGMVRFDTRSEKFTYFPSPQSTSFPKMEITRDGAIWFGPRDRGHPRVSVLYPDMTKITELGAYY